MCRLHFTFLAFAYFASERLKNLALNDPSWRCRAAWGIRTGENERAGQGYGRSNHFHASRDLEPCGSGAGHRLGHQVAAAEEVILGKRARLRIHSKRRGSLGALAVEMLRKTLP